MNLLQKIENKDAVIGIVGLGYVGLPLALEFVKKGFTVIGFELDSAKVNKLNNGEGYIKHIDVNKIRAAMQSGNLKATDDFSLIPEADAVIICVPTPLNEHREPDMTYVVNTAKTISRYLRKGQLVSLESTTYPGTTEEILLPLFENAPLIQAKNIQKQLNTESVANTRKLEFQQTEAQTADFNANIKTTVMPSILHEQFGSEPGTDDADSIVHSNGNGNGHAKFKVGKDFYLAFSPEREDPNNLNFSTSTIPKVVGGVTEECLKVAVALYNNVVVNTVPVTSTRAAEAAKLLENIFRCVNIALVNELKMVFERMDIDVWEVIKAASTKPFGFMPFYPGPGLGGHCIPIDPFYLEWKAREYEISTKFIELAGEINTYQPYYVVEKTLAVLNQFKKSINGAKILVLGAAYKKDIDDLRESPSLKLFELLKDRGAEIDYSDPNIPFLAKSKKFPHDMYSVEVTEENLKSYDLVLLATDHSAFDYNLISKHSKLIIDTRNAFEANGIKSNNVYKA